MKTARAHETTALPHRWQRVEPDQRPLAREVPRHDFLLALFAPVALATEPEVWPRPDQRRKFRTGDLP